MMLAVWLSRVCRLGALCAVVCVRCGVLWCDGEGEAVPEKMDPTEYGGVGGVIQPEARGHRPGVGESAMVMRIQAKREVAGKKGVDEATVRGWLESGVDPMKQE